jgi:hypothetical protein
MGSNTKKKTTMAKLKRVSPAALERSAAVVDWPSVGLTDDFRAPYWSVCRIPTHGRLTPCGN